VNQTDLLQLKYAHQTLYGKIVLVHWLDGGQERRTTGYLDRPQYPNTLRLGTEWSEELQAVGALITTIPVGAVTFFRELVERDALQRPSEEACLEFTRRALIQAGALVQTAIFGFWQRNGRPSQRSLEALRDRLTEAVDAALCEYYGASAGSEWERPRTVSDGDRLEWLQEDSTRLQDVYGRMENEEDPIRAAIDALMEMK
jgi:hypothetical protein